MTTSSTLLRPARLLRPLCVATATATVTAALVAAGATGTPARVSLTSADPIAIALDVSITPAPGWTPGNRGPDWVTLSNANGSAQMSVTVRQAASTDVVAICKADISQYIPSSHLTNVSDVSTPIPGQQGGKFPQQASVDYSAGLSGRQGVVPVLGTFTALLNPATGLSSFIDFRQSTNATPQAAVDGAAMINSML